MEEIIQPEESIIFFDSGVESSSSQQYGNKNNMNNKNASAVNPMLQRLHHMQKRNSFAVVQIESDSEDRSSDEIKKDIAALVGGDDKDADGTGFKRTNSKQILT